VCSSDLGDDGWFELLAPDGTEPVDIRPPVDYYASLSSVYAGARYSLNVASLLLPSALTQRHFDVWTAGGFLLTDATPGLDIFPEELTAPIRLASPQDLPGAVERLEREPALYRHLQRAWQNCLKEHTIRRRILTVLHCLDAAEP
jgi:spore maturation protein CgeB